MKKSITKFTLLITAFTILLIIIGKFIFSIIPAEKNLPFYIYLVAIFYISTIAFHIIIVKASFINSKKFISWFLAVTAFKLLFYLAIIIIYILINKATAVSFLLSFILLYLIYTSFEIISIIKLLKKTKYS